ncbi:MAG: F0F1 ATP synthase subunit B [Oscillospiraceae bacterium]|nr:F0F1 ATP synthase subunit B [Oscillospiraceae bacterium]
MENLILSARFLPLFNITPSTMILTLINTGVIVFLYWKFLHVKVVAIMDKRKEAIKTELDAATAANEKANEAEKQYKALLADSKAEADRIIAAATAKAREREEEILAEAKESAVAIRVKAEEDIERERKRALNEIKSQITEIVIMAAGAVAEKEIDSRDNAALIDTFLVNTVNQ